MPTLGAALAREWFADHSGAEIAVVGPERASGSGPTAVGVVRRRAGAGLDVGVAFAEVPP
jgi:hypothetical protein